MHPNPAFRKTPEAQNLDFARSRGFGALSVNGPEGPILAHVPFLLAPVGGMSICIWRGPIGSSRPGCLPRRCWP